MRGAKATRGCCLITCSMLHVILRRTKTKFLKSLVIESHNGWDCCICKVLASYHTLKLHTLLLCVLLHTLLLFVLLHTLLVCVLLHTLEPSCCVCHDTRSSQTPSKLHTLSPFSLYLPSLALSPSDEHMREGGGTGRWCFGDLCAAPTRFTSSLTRAARKSGKSLKIRK
jgi:hypothetical protein